MAPSTTPRRPRRTTRTSFGNVRKLPSGRYQARYTDSREQRHTAPQTFATKKQAEDWLATQRADIVRGTWRAPELGAITLGSYAADHLAMRLDLAPRTRDLYDQLLTHWLCQPLALPTPAGRQARSITLADYELSAIAPADVREWYAAALHTAHERAAERAESSRQRKLRATRHHARAWALAHGQPVKATGRLPQHILDAWSQAGSPAALAAAELAHPAPVPTDAGRARVAQAYRLLHMLLAQAVQDGRLDANPCHIPRAGQVKDSDRAPATPAQVAALAAAMPDHLAAAVHVAAWSGLRAGELFALARRHVDLHAGTVRVERAVMYLGDRSELGDTKTDSSRRTVHLPPHVVELLAEHMGRHTRPGPDALVFPDPRTGGILPRDLRQRAFWRARAAIGRTDLRWHDLRHTGATLAGQAGASMRELQHRLGHATVRAAMIYQHHSHDRDRELAQALGALALTPTNVVTLPLRTEAGA